jgi:hypothetical protein
MRALLLLWFAASACGCELVVGSDPRSVLGDDAGGEIARSGGTDAGADSIVEGGFDSSPDLEAPSCSIAPCTTQATACAVACDMGATTCEARCAPGGKMGPDCTKQCTDAQSECKGACAMTCHACVSATGCMAVDACDSGAP